MTAPIVFMDTETTGLSLDDDIWEFAAVSRDSDGTETELHLFIEHDGLKCRQLPDTFRVDHVARFPSTCSQRISTRKNACAEIAEFLGEDQPHIVGAVPNFDTERLSLMIEREWPHWPKKSLWHYHLIDIETMAVGYTLGKTGDLASLPWSSDDISEAVCVEPEQFSRHTAMGDVRWIMAQFDAITRHPS